MRQPWKVQTPWYWILLVLFVAGAVLICGNWETPDFLQWVSTRVRSDAWSRLVGIYFVSIVITHLVSFYTSRGIGVLLELEGPDTLPDIWSPALVGLAESVLYPTVLIAGKPDFIGVWLAVKVAGQWIRWGSDEKDRIKANEGRRRFNRFLVGNALSILAASATYGVIKIWALARVT